MSEPNLTSVLERPSLLDLTLDEAFGSYLTLGPHRVVDIGEDGGILVAGHLTDIDARAVWRYHERRVLGSHEWEQEEPPDAVHRWVRFRRHSQGCDLDVVGACSCGDEYSWWLWHVDGPADGVYAVTELNPW